MDFTNSIHKERFAELAPGKLATDTEWASVAFIISSDDELWRKCCKHMNANKREIKWDKIFNTDFGSGHKAALYYAFAMWSGVSWGGWVNDDGVETPMVDTMARSFSMGAKLARVVHQALAMRWGI